MNTNDSYRVIIQAGGRGTRLQPYTTILPKPLMPVLEYPILEIMIRQLVAQGFPKITITLGHLGHLIMAVVGDGSRWGAEVDYVTEDEPRGTIGAITLVHGLDRPFLVMNGDLLTDFNFREFMRKHLSSGARLSVGVHRKEVPISLGVFEFDGDHRIIEFKEKPILHFPCSMGIYAFDPALLPFIPDVGNFGFDNLMNLCLSQQIRVCAHPFDGLWLDIGRPDDYANATLLFQENRARLLPDVCMTPSRGHGNGNGNGNGKIKANGNGNGKANGNGNGNGKANGNGHGEHQLQVPVAKNSNSIPRNS